MASHKVQSMNPLTYLSSPHYRPDIDGLRALAVISVVLCHAFPQWFGGGFVGVDVFFVISGYLISSIIFRDVGRGVFSFWDFYAKRARRIFPALIFVIAVGLLIGAVFLTPREYKELGYEAFLGSVFVENLRLARGIDYFGLEIARKPFMHLWSLGVEEQFYLFFPLLVWLCWKACKGRIGTVLALLVAASFVTENYYQPLDESKAYFWPHCRFWQLGAGVLLAYIHYRAQEHPLCAAVRRGLERFGTPLAAVGLIGLIGCLFTFGAVTDVYPGYAALVPTVSAVLIIAAGREALPNRILLAKPATVYIGWLSYPLYLWHWLFLSVAFSLYAGHPPLWVNGLMVVSASVMAFISFTFVEVPIRRLKATRKLLFVTLGVLLVTAALSGFVSKADGIPQRLTGQTLAALKTITNDREVRPEHRCPNKYDFVCWSLTGKEDGDVLLIGNSHTEHMMNVFAKYAPKGVRVDIYAAGGTRPLEDVVSRMTDKQLIRDGKMHQVLAAVKKSDASVVVVSNTWGHIDPNEVVLLKDGSFDRFEAVFRRTVEGILNSGKKLVYLIDNPVMPNEMENCMELRPVNVMPGRCSIPRSDYDSQVRSQFQYFTRMAKEYPGRVFVVESGRALCDDVKCSMLDAEGWPLYTDTGHLTDRGADIVVREAWKGLQTIVK